MDPKIFVRGWDPEIFDHYDDEGRWIHRPAKAVVVKETLDEFVLPEELLELGAGIGELTSLVGSDFAKRIVHIDQIPELVRINKERFPGSNVVVGDIYNLSFSDSIFSTVIGYSSLDTLQDLAAGLREIYRVLQDGGRLIHFLDLYPNPQVILSDLGDEGVMFPHPVGNIMDNEYRFFKKDDYWKNRDKLNPEVLNFLDLYVDNPLFGYISLEELPIQERGDVILKMDKELERAGIGEVSSSPEYFKSKLDGLLQNNGFNIKTSAFRKKEITIPRDPKYPEDSNQFDGILGLDFRSYNPKIKANEIKVSAVLYVAVAIK